MRRNNLAKGKPCYRVPYDSSAVFIVWPLFKTNTCIFRIPTVWSDLAVCIMNRLYDYSCDRTTVALSEISFGHQWSKQDWKLHSSTDYVSHIALGYVECDVGDVFLKYIFLMSGVLPCIPGGKVSDCEFSPVDHECNHGQMQVFELQEAKFVLFVMTSISVNLSKWLLALGCSYTPRECATSNLADRWPN